MVIPEMVNNVRKDINDKWMQTENSRCPRSFTSSRLLFSSNVFIPYWQRLHLTHLSSLNIIGCLQNADLAVQQN